MAKNTPKRCNKLLAAFSGFRHFYIIRRVFTGGKKAKNDNAKKQEKNAHKCYSETRIFNADFSWLQRWCFLKVLCA